MKANKNKWFKWILIGVAVFLIVSSFFGGREYSKRFWEREIAQRDSLINNSEVKQDSLSLELLDYELLSDELQTIIDDKNYYNNTLYQLLKQKERENFITDTSFMRNAERIADSVDRYHSRTNDFR